jgi:hypothetical protein
MLSERKETMGGFIGAGIGAILATFGFLVMRDPMRLAMFAPGARGYYQRMVLDTSSRNQLRMLGVLVCIFGLCIGTAGSAGLLKSRVLQSISDGFLVLLWLVFISVCVAGLILQIVQLARGRGFGDSFQKWRTSAALGEVNVYPLVTPRMRREATQFTITFAALVCITIVAAFVSRR